MTDSNFSKRDSAASIHLDLLRGMSAMAVLVYHVRYRFFVDYADSQSHGLVAKIFYALTSFGHDAVMAFFVLSGLFISASIARSSRKQRWSWTEYLLTRLTRLSIVLIPALALTWVWDSIGVTLYGENAVYTGASQTWRHDYFDVKSRLSSTNLLGNLTYLQTIFVPPYGSNDPLWSLAYEFWYYGLFPCLYLPLFIYSSWSSRLVCLGIAVAITVLVSKTMLLYFPIWLLGAGICFVPSIGFLEGRGRIPATVFSVLLAMTLASAGHIDAIKQAMGGSTITMDYLTGVGVAILVYVILHHREPAPQKAYAMLARKTANISFTLYLTHIPLLVLLRAAWIPDRPWDVSPKTIAFAVGINLVAIAYAVIVYWLAERHTAAVKSWVFARLANWSLIADRSQEQLAR